MASSVNCVQSSLQVFDGPHKHSSELGDRICGRSLVQRVESTGNELYLMHFSEAQNNTDQFKIKYSFSGWYKSI